MLAIDEILKIKTQDEFAAAAMDVFCHQAQECEPYCDYLKALGISEKEVANVAEIPFLPIEIFKTHRVYCGASEPEAVFTSSGDVSSKHYVAHLSDYEAVYVRCFESFYGSPADWSIRSLLPCYEEREGSSLIYMIDGLKKMGREDGRKMLFGVSYALLDLAESGEKLPQGTVVMETGGMKGRREEMPKALMHSILQQAFDVPEIHSEYGMAELMSQAYSRGGGIFCTVPWMRVLVRDPADPFDVKPAGRGAINIIDLANLNSCAFIQTQDVGTVFQDGSFTVDGREVKSDIRGCNLLTQ